MAQAREAVEEVLGCGAFYAHALAAFPFPARRVQRSLWVQAEVHGVHHHLHMALRLHEATHHAEGAYGPAALGQEARDDGVVRPLAGCQAVGVLGVE